MKNLKHLNLLTSDTAKASDESTQKGLDLLLGESRTDIRVERFITEKITRVFETLALNARRPLQYTGSTHVLPKTTGGKIPRTSKFIRGMSTMGDKNCFREYIYRSCKETEVREYACLRDIGKFGLLRSIGNRVTDFESNALTPDQVEHAAKQIAMNIEYGKNNYYTLIFLVAGYEKQINDPEDDDYLTSEKQEFIRRHKTVHLVKCLIDETKKTKPIGFYFMVEEDEKISNAIVCLKQTLPK